MQNELDGKFLLSVYAKIEKHGQQVKTENGTGYQLLGITISQGFDGYEVYFDNGKVQLMLGFHHKWHSTAKSELEMDEFISTLKQINRNYQ